MGFSTRTEGEITQLFPTGGYTPEIAAGIYTIQHNPFMGPYLQTLAVKTDELLDMPGTAADEVMADVRQFLSKRAEFERYGFNHKRGYLMYGPPGTGKSSIAQLCARRFVADGGIVVMAEGAGDLPSAVDFVKAYCPGRNLMVIIEDPDEEDMDDTEVLAVLDGTKSVAGLVTICTTNHKSKMSPRIANRPGRFDRVVRVDRINPKIQLAFLEQLQNRNPEGVKPAKDLVKALEGLPLTLAHLKEAFLAHVLLGATLKEIRARFERMAKTGDQEGDDNEVDAEDFNAVPTRSPKAKIWDKIEALDEKYEDTNNPPASYTKQRQKLLDQWRRAKP